jgi:hypothetical protein
MLLVFVVVLLHGDVVASILITPNAGVKNVKLGTLCSIIVLGEIEIRSSVIVVTSIDVSIPVFVVTTV